MHKMLSNSNNVHKHKRTQQKQCSELSAEQISNLPETYRHLWITNKRLHKQIDILNIQLQQKDRIIKQLKVQIDSTILQDTKSKLQIVRIVQQEVQQKVKQARQEYLNKLSSYEQEIDKKIAYILQMQKQIQAEKQRNLAITSKHEQIRKNIIIAFEQKQLIIEQLTKIINEQQLAIKMGENNNKFSQQYKPCIKNKSGPQSKRQKKEAEKQDVQTVRLSNTNKDQDQKAKKSKSKVQISKNS